jgi:hypothetical protein
MKSTSSRKKTEAVDDDLISRLREDGELRRHVARMLRDELATKRTKVRPIRDVGRLRR